MPAVMKIKRKPNGVGCEIKNLADSHTHYATNEGKTAMDKKMAEGVSSRAKFEKEVARPQIVADYFDGSAAIDIHNHIRQSGLALENVWSTTKWQHRIFASVFGIIETNSYLAFNYFRKDVSEPISHQQFTERLSKQLIDNVFNQNFEENNNDTTPPANVTLHGLHMLQSVAKIDQECNGNM
ncbi:hypothetical protein FQR65_LT05498 [Abscondita terminalis]|nr:hypothetical protein FQR65_LT05498 [Abscondita terminalis]